MFPTMSDETNPVTPEVPQLEDAPETPEVPHTGVPNEDGDGTGEDMAAGGVGEGGL